MMLDIKNNIKNRLVLSIREKFAHYKPETSYMPFHTRLLGKDRMALYSFIQSLNTNFGVTIFEPAAEELGRVNFDRIEKQYEAGKIITKDAQRVIQDIMDDLESARIKPDKTNETKRILEVAHSGEIVEIKPTKVDLFLEKNNEIYLIDIKTAKPNKGGFKEFKRTLLTWIAVCAYQYPQSSIHTLIAIPYNPYFPKPYQRWTMAGMLEIENELKVDREFWDFVGGLGSYEIILDAFEEVGKELRVEIDEYFKKFNLQS